MCLLAFLYSVWLMRPRVMRFVVLSWLVLLCNQTDVCLVFGRPVDIYMENASLDVHFPTSYTPFRTCCYIGLCDWLNLT